MDADKRRFSNEIDVSALLGGCKKLWVTGHQVKPLDPAARVLLLP